MRKHGLKIAIILMSLTGVGASGQQLVPASAIIVRPSAPAQQSFDGDYYMILGVERDATLADIKAAYRKMARRWHPDQNNGSKEAETKFKLIQKAYDTLKDEGLRERYDEQGPAQRSRGNVDDIVRAFINGSDAQRDQILNAFAEVENWRALEQMLAGIGKLASDDAQAFRSLIFFVSRTKRNSDFERAGLRSMAIDLVTHSQPYRPEVVADSLKFVSDLFGSQDKFIRGGELEYELSVPIKAFFETEEISDEHFYESLPQMTLGLLKSHSGAWGALTKNLERLDRRYPGITETLLDTFISAIRIAIAGKSTGAHQFDLSIGLIKIAQLRPEFKEKVRSVVKEAKPLFGGGFVEGGGFTWVFIRKAPYDPFALELLQWIIGQEYSTEQAEKIRGTMSTEYFHFFRDMHKRSAEDVPKILRVISLLKESGWIKAERLAKHECELQLISQSKQE